MMALKPFRNFCWIWHFRCLLEGWSLEGFPWETENASFWQPSSDPMLQPEPALNVTSSVTGQSTALPLAYCQDPPQTVDSLDTGGSTAPFALSRSVSLLSTFSTGKSLGSSGPGCWGLTLPWSLSPQETHQCDHRWSQDNRLCHF